MEDYIQDKWISTTTSNASDDLNKAAGYGIDFPNLNYYWEISSVPHPGEDEITYAQGGEPYEIELLGKKFSLFTTDNP